MKKFLLLFLLPACAFAQAFYHIKPSDNCTLSNGADYEMRFEFNMGGAIRDFIVPRDAVLKIYLPTNTNYTLTIYRGDTNASVTSYTSTTLPDFYVRYYGIRQTATNAFTAYVTSYPAPAPEQFVQYNTTPNVWVQNTELGYPIDVAVTSGGGGGASSTPAQESTDYFDTFTLGFWTGLGWELFGLMIAIVRRLRTSTGME